MNDVTIIGLGYIGLPTAVILAEYGLRVTGVDIDQTRVDAVNNAAPVFHEPDLQQRLQKVVTQGFLQAEQSVVPAHYYIIAVPTPHTETNKADLRAVWAAADALLAVIKAGDCVILESTVPVGVTRALAERLAKATQLHIGSELFVAHSPERVLPGKIFTELVHNNRVIGGVTARCAAKAALLYKNFVRGEINCTQAAVAEMVKLVENASRDVQIAFAHQVAGMAESINLDPLAVIALANKHPRVNILQPTCGVGGHCIAIDPWFLIESFPEHTSLLQAARKVNDNRPLQIIVAIERAIEQWQQQHPGQQCRILLAGITYKPDVDDIRESPALQIVQYFAKKLGDRLHVVDPMVSHAIGSRLVAPAIFKPSVAEIEQADLVFYLVKHTAFAQEKRDLTERSMRADSKLHSVSIE